LSIFFLWGAKILQKVRIAKLFGLFSLFTFSFGQKNVAWVYFFLFFFFLFFFFLLPLHHDKQLIN